MGAEFKVLMEISTADKMYTATALQDFLIARLDGAIDTESNSAISVDLIDVKEEG